MRTEANEASNATISMPGPRRARYSTIAATLLVGCVFVAGGVGAAEPGMDELKKTMQGQLELMKPELRERAESLSTDTKMSLMAILAMHNRYSKQATMRQVMTEVLSDFQSILAGIMTENPEHTADSARRLANHRIPVGGLLPYLGLENISDERLAVLESFNTSVEGNALKLAAAADQGDMTTAASLVGQIASGCVACHGVFRGQPGASNLLR